jgi:hypothetical protein
MTRNISLLFSLAASLVLPWAVGAQNPQPAAPHETNPPVASPNAPQPPPERIEPGGSAQGTPGRGSLSDQLSRREGTLQPPSVDPGIQAPLPNSRTTMPVIPPPGAAGGDQRVVPK